MPTPAWRPEPEAWRRNKTVAVIVTDCWDQLLSKITKVARAAPAAGAFCFRAETIDFFYAKVCSKAETGVWRGVRRTPRTISEMVWVLFRFAFSADVSRFFR